MDLKELENLLQHFLPPLVTDPDILTQYPQINTNLYALILDGSNNTLRCKRWNV